MSARLGEVGCIERRGVKVMNKADPSLSLVREGISKCEMTETEMWEIPYRGACG